MNDEEFKMSKEEIKDKSEERKDTAKKAESKTNDNTSKQSGKKGGSSNKLMVEIIACVVAVAAIVVAMIFVLKGKEKKYDLTHLETKEPTVFDAGNVECWYDVTKNSYYSDKKGKNQISPESVFLYVFDYNTTGVVKYDQDGIVYYVKGGTVDKTYTGFAKDENKDWYYFTKGVNDASLNDVIKGSVYGEDAWWCVKGGKVAFIDTVAENSNGWWNIVKGKVVFEDTIATDENGSWYCKGGKVDFGYTGEFAFEKKIYDIKGGKVMSVKDDPKYEGKVEYYVDKSESKDVVTSENEKTLIKGFKSFESATGVRPYLYIIESLPSDTLDDYLEELAGEVFGSNDGIIIVYVDFEDMFWIYTPEGSSIGLKDKTKITEAIRKNQDESDRAARFGNALKSVGKKLSVATEKSSEEATEATTEE